MKGSYAGDVRKLARIDAAISSLDDEIRELRREREELEEKAARIERRLLRRKA